KERAQDILNGTSGETPTDTTENVVFKLPNETDPSRQLILDDGSMIRFSYMSSLTDKLEMRADRDRYKDDGSGAVIHISVTNTVASDDTFQLYGLLKDAKGSMEFQQYL